MSHLTKEQLEDILRDSAHIPEHVDHCPLCRARLEEERALARRVRQAFLSIQTPAVLAERIRADVAPHDEATAAVAEPARIIPLQIRRHLWSGLAAAAAILIVALPIAFFIGTGSQVNAAQVALEEIHHTNVESLGQLVTNDDPNVLCEYLRSQVGHSPAMRCMGPGMSVCGCCVRRFQGQPVASYVIKRNNTPVSVIAVPQSPESLGMVLAKRGAGGAQDIWQAKHKCCNMAAVQIGEHSYCAVGEVPQEELAIVLTSLAGQAQTSR